jgi:hypothetical protein
MAEPLLIALLDDFVDGLIRYTEGLQDERRRFIWEKVIPPEIDGPQEAKCRLSVRLKPDAPLASATQRVAYAVAQVIEDEELTFTVRCLGIERILPLRGDNLARVYEEVTRQLRKQLTSAVAL